MRPCDPQRIASIHRPEFAKQPILERMIENVIQLRQAAREAGGLIQQIADFQKRHPRLSDEGLIRFPRGYLRTATDFRARLQFVADKTLRSNVAYALMTHDVFRWLVFHTDIGGQAREMLIKEGVCLLGNVCESITIFPGEYGLGRKAGYKGRVARLRALDVIGDDAVNELLWLWDKRNQEHLFDVPLREWGHYKPEDWYRSVRTWRGLAESLIEWRG